MRNITEKFDKIVLCSLNDNSYKKSHLKVLTNRVLY